MITEGYLVRHYQGRSGGRGPALIDIAQDHLLFHLSARGLFDLGAAPHERPPAESASAWPAVAGIRLLRPAHSSSGAGGEVQVRR